MTTLNRKLGLHLLVMAKAPVPGRVKTRLCPPLDPTGAARVAECCLAMTLEAVSRCSASRKLLALDGEPGGWIPAGFTVFAQAGHTFADRLSHAWDRAGGGGFQIGMDTPQLSAAQLDRCLERIETVGDNGAVLGPAADGGWWGVGTAEPWRADVFAGVAMSTPDTGTHQSARLQAAGYQVHELHTERDIDTYADAVLVAAGCPDRRLAELLADLAGRFPAATLAAPLDPGPFRAAAAAGVGTVTS